MTIYTKYITSHNISYVSIIALKTSAIEMHNLLILMMICFNVNNLLAALLISCWLLTEDCNQVNGGQQRW